MTTRALYRAIMIALSVHLVSACQLSMNPAIGGTQLDELWMSRFGTRIVSKPLILDDLVIVQTADAVVALEAPSGNAMWRTALMAHGVRNPSMQPIAHGAAVLVGAAEGRLAALAVRDGTLLWQTEVVPHEWIEDLIVADEVIYMAAYGGEIRAYSEIDGTAMWRRHAAGHSGLWEFVGPGMLYVGTQTSLLAFERPSGVQRWELNFGDTAAQMAADADHLYVSFDSWNEEVSVFAYSLESGAEKWAVDSLAIKGSQDMVVEEGVIYIAGSGVTAISATNGDIIWSSHGPGPWGDLAINDDLILARNPTELYVLSAGSGQLENQYMWPGRRPLLSWSLNHAVGPAVADDRLFLANEEILYAFDLEAQ